MIIWNSRYTGIDSQRSWKRLVKRGYSPEGSCPVIGLEGIAKTYTIGRDRGEGPHNDQRSPIVNRKP